MTQDELIVHRMSELAAALREQLPETDRFELRRQEDFGWVEVKFLRRVGDQKMGCITPLSDHTLVETRLDMSQLASYLIRKWEDSAAELVPS